MPKKGFLYFQTVDAFMRLRPLSPIPISELRTYFDCFDIPLSFESFIDVMRALEIDAANKARETSERD